VVEVLGLRRWTLAMVQDSLAKHAPGESLASHACAAVLRYKLGFADAAAMVFAMAGGPAERTVVAVREPQDSARVHYRALPLDTTGARPHWRAVTDGLARRPGEFWPAVDAAARADSAGRPWAWRPTTPGDSAAAAAVRAFARDHATEADRREALDALARSPSLFDRTAAVLILTNFGARDDTWWALTDALRETEGPVKGMAALALEGLARREPRAVDWGPAAESIRAILDGTSLFVLHQLADVLARTGAGPEHARGFLKGGGEILVAYLGSGTPLLADRSHALLVQLRGADLGRDPAAWRAWIAGL
jgi:hypothetical protein